MPWTNPDYEPETPQYNPEPLDDDPWNVDTSTEPEPDDDETPPQTPPETI